MGWVLLSLLIVGLGAAWLHTDLRKRVKPNTSLIASIGLGVVVWLLAAWIASAMVAGQYANVIGAGTSLLFSGGIARPVSTRLRKRLGA